MAKLVKPDVMAAARRMTGAVAAGDQFRVKLDVELYPSELHVPLHRPDAPLTAERLVILTDVLHSSEILFAPRTAEIRPEEKGKLEQAARAMREVGPRVRFVVGGHFLGGDSAKAREDLARNRAAGVVRSLSGLGVAPEQMEVTTFALAAGSGLPDAPQSQKVEIRVR